MSPLEWNDKMSVGHKELDAQHKELIALFNEIERTLDQGRPAQETEEFVKRLAAYTRYHCEFEEILMDQAGYRDFDAHRHEHRELLEQVERVIAQQEGTGQNSADALKDLRERYRTHLLQEDRLYSPAL